ncbi:hypothetical protein [Bacillus sp. PS06]|uniref:hypothetical protein n=1 Tax=Bacillus sp. PS06 TaxID=2764176 RepID=UPI001783C017|nr:hypothetical protein [Bacillus sp. PS06]MBD8071430.1 hypothetical protein [Bacillus sp. PS06]
MINLNQKLLLFVIFLLILPIKTTAANDRNYEDEDSPISFTLEILPWQQVDGVIPKGAKFTVIDVETGMYFKVQRRAGSQHADVQPLTRKDTQVMKKIYNGKWSWNRRAIIVVAGDQLIAASMHGMPHGGGALQNGFPGHFCIHFFGSTTHRTRKLDATHHLMILKAGGKLDEYVETVDPYELITIFATGINMEDKRLLELSVGTSENDRLIRTLIKDLRSLEIIHMPLLPVEDLNELVLVEIPVQVKYAKKHGRKVKKEMNFIARRDSHMNQWYIDGEYFLKELK